MPSYDSTILHPAAHDLTGKTFHYWTVLRFAGYKKYVPYYTCECRCGNIADVTARYLRNGMSKSCGCWRVEQGITTNTTHGLSHTAEWRIWHDMIRRCEDPRVKRYPNYGGRGITVCPEWHDFLTFFHDVGPRPSLKYGLERLNNNQGYYKENVVWATNEVQQRNTTRNRMITHNGKTQCIAAWAEETGLTPRAIWGRLERGWSDEKTLTTPAGR